MSYRHIQTSV